MYINRENNKNLLQCCLQKD